MVTEQEQLDHTVSGRVAKLESDGAAMRSDIRGIFAGLDEIRDVLVRMQDNARPNLGGMFMVLLATCTFLVTVGGLSLAPLYNDMAQLYESQARAAEATADLEKILRDEIQKSETHISENRDRISYIEGYIKGKGL